MKKYAELNRNELLAMQAELSIQYKKYCDSGLKLDLSRGKPNASQLDMSQGLMDVSLEKDDCRSEAGFDCRNYGLLEGLPEMKEFFAKLFGLQKEDIIIGGNSSLQLMYDTLSRAMLYGVCGSKKPWCREEKVKWICVTPGYDRHFKVTETLGFELLSVNMKDTGPDMDEVERLVKDPAVKGIWCVPKYSNPTGNTYSDETVTRLAKMECAARDFRIMWDNAYAIHDFTDNGDVVLDIMSECKKYGNEDRVFYFASTSKMTFPGSGVSFFAASENNRRQIIPYLGVSTIGFDKINQLRHLKYFKTPENLLAHMQELGKVIKSKFDITLEKLQELCGLGIAEWTEPRGGYFISLDVLPGTAKRVFGR